MVHGGKRPPPHFKETDTMLFRGKYKLPHMSQVLGRDQAAEVITMALTYGKTRACGFRRTAEQIADPYSLPYEYLISDPHSAGSSWTAFYDRAGLQTWLDAYGCTLDCEPDAGGKFFVLLPADESAFAPLTDDGAEYKR
uniref:hypothetical protein n=1 Tax=Nonomuraea sp. CA-251285 TaxID=3240002 RepID=UPI003F49AA03